MSNMRKRRIEGQREVEDLGDIELSPEDSVKANRMIAEADAELEKKKGMSQRPTVGFGCPNGIDPHHYTVAIPAGRTGDVVITERFGLSGGHNGLPDAIERCRLPRAAWTGIAEQAKRVLNERLKEAKISTSRWMPGENKVERLLGRELCLLAWATERADPDLIPNAIRNWLGLRPEERWWLFAMAASATGSAEDADIGWRKAIRIALTENPTSEEMIEVRAARPKPPPDRPALPLFDIMGIDVP